MDKIKRWYIIKKAIKRVRQRHKDTQPQIVDSLFFGAYGLAPQYLAIWYLFKTNADEEQARTEGLEDRIKKDTIDYLITLGYPREAFNKTIMGWVTESYISKGADKITFTERHPEYSVVNILFTSREDVELKANGDYRLFFQ